MKRRTGKEREVSIALSKVMLPGTLCVPKEAPGIAIFAHGSGSSRLSPRNQYVAAELQSQGVGTLLFDLLTSEEEAFDERTGQLRFDIRLLAKRLVNVTHWVEGDSETFGLRIGYFGASTGAAAALAAAAQLPGKISAVVSRGGRPDLAGEALPLVEAATLLIVGGNDESVLCWNRIALADLGCRDKRLEIIPGATHLFEEEGALANVAELAAAWFASHFSESEQGQAHKTAQER
ncbi:MAG: dienelactone hydrolase family protein [Acidobacteriia bacterium]|nr:dienelactone hydrolase family protein [Terriglobia bacterium]